MEEANSLVGLSPRLILAIAKKQYDVVVPRADTFRKLTSVTNSDYKVLRSRTIQRVLKLRNVNTPNGSLIQERKTLTGNDVPQSASGCKATKTYSKRKAETQKNACIVSNEENISAQIGPVHIEKEKIPTRRLPAVQDSVSVNGSSSNRTPRRSKRHESRNEADSNELIKSDSRKSISTSPLGNFMCVFTTLSSSEAAVPQKVSSLKLDKLDDVSVERKEVQNNISIRDTCDRANTNKNGKTQSSILALSFDKPIFHNSPSPIAEPIRSCLPSNSTASDTSSIKRRRISSTSEMRSFFAKLNGESFRTLQEPEALNSKNGSSSPSSPNCVIRLSPKDILMPSLFEFSQSAGTRSPGNHKLQSDSPSTNVIQKPSCVKSLALSPHEKAQHNILGIRVENKSTLDNETLEHGSHQRRSSKCGNTFTSPLLTSTDKSQDDCDLKLFIKSRQLPLEDRDIEDKENNLDSPANVICHDSETESCRSDTLTCSSVDSNILWHNHPEIRVDFEKDNANLHDYERSSVCITPDTSSTEGNDKEEEKIDNNNTKDQLLQVKTKPVSNKTTKSSATPIRTQVKLKALSKSIVRWNTEMIGYGKSDRALNLAWKKRSALLYDAFLEHSNSVKARKAKQKRKHRKAKGITGNKKHKTRTYPTLNTRKRITTKSLDFINKVFARERQFWSNI